MFNKMKSESFSKKIKIMFNSEINIFDLPRYRSSILAVIVWLGNIAVCLPSGGAISQKKTKSAWKSLKLQGEEKWHHVLKALKGEWIDYL